MMLLAAIGMTGCEEEIVLDKGETPLVVNLSTDSVQCDQRSDAQEALQITWTSGTNQGTGAAIAYFFEMDLKGNNFEGGIKYNIGKTDSRVITFTHKELTDTLLHYFPTIPLEQYSDFEMRVTATVASASVPTQVSPVKGISIAPYKWRVLNLYIIGDATPNGWDNQLATPMIRDYDNIAQFTWQGMLKKGEIKFNAQLGDWYPCYVRDNDDPTQMHYREKEEDYPDNKWVIDVAGNYLIDVNLDLLTVSFTNLDGNVPFTTLYLVGDAAPTAIKLDQSSDDPFIFTYNGPLAAGNMLISSTTATSGCAGYQPADNNGLGTTNILQINDIASASNQWNIPSANKYSVELDLRNNLLTIGNYVGYEHIWIMGSAAPGGWSWDNITEMQRDASNPNVFTYEGPLKAESATTPGELKFPLEIDHSFGGDFILAPQANCPMSANGTYFIGNQPDNKWIVPESEAGNYRITIDVENETISFVKL